MLSSRIFHYNFFGQVRQFRKYQGGPIRWIVSLTALGFGFILAILGSPSTTLAQSPNPNPAQPTQQNSPATIQQLTDEIRQLLAQAGREYRSGNTEQAVSLLHNTVDALDRLTKQSSSPRDLNAAKSAYAAISKAYERLEIDGILLNELPDWDSLETAIRSQIENERQSMTRGNRTRRTPEASSSPASPAATVAFETDIAHWLVSKCGRCHINESRGRFAMKDFNELIAGPPSGTVLFPGDPSGSRLVEVIRTGDMPRGGTKVTTDELQKLETWIREGANLSQELRSIPFTTLVNAANASNALTPTPSSPSMNELTASKPTGKETVSFSRDIAPILIENCNGCHINANQRRGNLSMDTFAQFLRGGDSGQPIVPSKSQESLLVRKLKGEEGQRMPAGGRPPLSDQQIQLIATWIDEGNTFDGQSNDASIQAVSARAWAENASHEEMMARRKERAIQKWQTAFGSNSEPRESSDTQFVVLGDLPEKDLENLRNQAQQATNRIKKLVRATPSQSLAKGGVTIFAMKNRYQYSEFGKMNEARSLPTNWKSHWRRDVLDTYIAIVFEPNDPNATTNALNQQLASLWFSHPQETPPWLAEGFGRATLANLAGKSEPKSKEWETRLPSVLSAIGNVNDLLEGKMNEDDAAIVGYWLAKRWMEPSNRRQFESFLKSLEQTGNFKQAYSQVFGTSFDDHLRSLFKRP